MARQATLGIVSHERIARTMSGPGIRCWELARALSRDARVILLTPADSDLEPEGFELETYTPDNLVQKVGPCDALLCQGFTINSHPELKKLGKSFIVDLYCPLTLEALAQYGHLSLDEQGAIQGSILLAVMEQLSVGSFFVCASDRQRDYWLGMLSAAGRIMPEEFERDATFRELIGLVPFGLPDQPPQATGRALKGVHQAIGEDDRVLLWGGGIYNWFDPFTPIRAMGALAERRSDVKMFFICTGHPHPGVPKMRANDEAIELSRELGLLGKSVIFNDGWVDYQNRVNYLLESDIGIYANIPHVETRFSFRTRVLDCFWSGLPVLATEGDVLSDMVRERELGLVVPSGDHIAFADAVERLLDDGELNARCRENMKAVSRDFTWSRAAQPIKEFLERLAEGQVAEPVAHPLGMANLAEVVKDLERKNAELEGTAPGASGKSLLRVGSRAARKAVRAGRRRGGSAARTAGKNLKAARRRITDR